MRILLLRAVIYIGKICLNIIYCFMKLLPTRNKIVMLSRQSSKVNIDFELIENEILKRTDKIEIKILCRVLKKDNKSRLEYCFYILKCMHHVATAKVCILDGYSIPISILKHKKNLEIIQIWHASGALKKFGYQSLNKKEGRGEGIAKLMNMHKNYTHVIAPTPYTARFYEEAFNVNPKQIVINGLPRLDYILGTEESDKKFEEFYREYPKFKNKKTILYVPTFRKDIDNTKYINKLIKQVNFKQYNLIIKLHPLDKSNVIDKYQVNKQYHTFDLIRIADYIITDYSAVAFEASLLDKPLYFYVYDIEEYKKIRGLNVDLFREMKGCTSKNIGDILELIKNDNYNFKELYNFRLKYMGNNCKDNTKKLADFVFKYLDKDVINEELENNIDEHSEEELNV